MSFSDFYSIFDEIQFVHIDLSAFFYNKDLALQECSWETILFDGAWISGKNAGGSGNIDCDHFWNNPQYVIHLTNESIKENEISIIVSLIQTEQTRKRLESDGKYQSSNEAISFRLYKVLKKPCCNSKYKKNDLKEIGDMGAYVKQREFSKKFTLLPGGRLKIFIILNQIVN
jgi:hypothetical protein